MHHEILLNLCHFPDYFLRFHYNNASQLGTTANQSTQKSSIFRDGVQDIFLTHCGDGAGIKNVYVFREYRGIPRYSPKQNEMQRAIIHWMNIRIFSLYAFHKYKWSINDFWKCTYLNWSTLEFLISIPVRLLLFGYFPHQYVFIWTITSIFLPLCYGLSVWNIFNSFIEHFDRKKVIIQKLYRNDFY
mgnify:CR=1 FL=1